MANKDDKLVVELGDSSKLEVSVQTYQAIHKLLTGKPDKMTKFYEQPFEIELDDLIQLHKKINQVCSQYDLISINFYAVINHIGDSKNELASLELYDRTQNCPVESILLKYNIVLMPMNVPPELKKPQNFSITIKFFSEIALIKEFKKIREKFIGGENLLIGSYSAKVDIEYADYLVAKNINHIVDECIKGFGVAKFSTGLKFIISQSRVVSLILKYVVFSTILILTYLYIPKYSLILNDKFLLGRFLVISCGALFFSYMLGDYYSRKTRVILMDLEKKSSINLNKGDVKLISEEKQNEKSFILQIIIQFFVAFLISIATTISMKYISPYLI